MMEKRDYLIGDRVFIPKKIFFPNRVYTITGYHKSLYVLNSGKKIKGKRLASAGKPYTILRNYR